MSFFDIVKKVASVTSTAAIGVAKGAGSYLKKYEKEKVDTAWENCRGLSNRDLAGIIKSEDSDSIDRRVALLRVYDKSPNDFERIIKDIFKTSYDSYEDEEAKADLNIKSEMNALKKLCQSTILNGEHPKVNREIRNVAERYIKNYN